MKLVNKFLSAIGLKLYSTKDANVSFADIDNPEFWEFYAIVKEYTMVSIPNLYSLYNSALYVVKNGIEGDFVECGVWRGGCSMMVALVFKKYGVTDRKIYMYDTFEGMPPPSEQDFDFKNSKAKDLLKIKPTKERNSIWCIADIEDVSANIKLTKYALDNFVLIKGKVEDTLNENLPKNKLAILRLDTDWYESTKEELERLYPILITNGVLIIDDYGHWQGARRAVDEYLQENGIHLLLNRVDYTCRLAIVNH
ncbi:MAG: TylF/MycF/NovP-related O-methyltransferase [Bacteroidota bacterium]